MHLHNEGVGKWYLYTSDQIEVRAPTRGRLCPESSADRRGGLKTIEGHDVLDDNRLYLWIGEQRALQYGHMAVLKEIFDRIDQAGEEGLEVSSGELLGFTRGGSDYSALDFQYHDNAKTNGLPESEVLGTIPHTFCPMDIFSGELKDALLTRWRELTWDPAVAAKALADQTGSPARVENAELAQDTCSFYNIDTANQGSIFGNWYNTLGIVDGNYIYTRGTVSLVPNAMLNQESYTVGWFGQDGLWSEMLPTSIEQQAPWIPGVIAAGLYLADGAQASQRTGCFAISPADAGDPKAVWVAWELTVAADGNDALSLSRAGADAASCQTAGTGSDPELRLVRYP